MADAARQGGTLEVRGGGSKADIGVPGRQSTVLSMCGFSDVVEYEPSELVLTVGAGMPLSRVQALIDEHQQVLAFEPFDHGPIFGRAAGAATIGGVIAAGVSGSRRVSAGAVRDHVLGFEAVSGRGERFVAGGRVVKNVTGYDLPKLMAGSWGQLVALTQVTLKVLPKPRESKTVALRGLDDARAIGAMCLAMRSQAEVAAAAARVGDESLTCFRLEGFGPSVSARAEMLRSGLAEFGASEVLRDENAVAFWQSVRDVTPLKDGRPLWRVNVPATAAPLVTASLREHDARWYYDWAGGLIWLTLPTSADAAIVRKAAARAGGHAALVRADATLRAAVSALHPEPPAVTALARRIKAAFDPANILDPLRFSVTSDAN
jgi:glycolate oxidase FAD binding subunit